jgi:hypothetical protein
MIKTNTQDRKYSSVKEIREREQKEQEIKLKEDCEALALERYGDKAVKQWSNQNKGIWYLPVLNTGGDKIEALAIMKPVDRNILSYASTKITEEGLYAFLEACMRECFIAGDECILDDDDFFIPAASKFNAILEGRKAALLKR